MTNPLDKTANETIRRATKYLICCGFDRKTAHAVARAQYLANLLKEVTE